MSVYKPKGSTIYLYDFRRCGDRFYGSTGQKTKRAAEQFENLKRAEAAIEVRKRPVTSLDDAAGRYEDKLRADNRWSADTERWIGSLVAALGPQRYMSAIGETEVADYFRSRAAVVSGSSVNREIDVAKALWRSAAKYDIGDMPDWKAMRYAVVKPDPREASFDEEDRIFAQLREDYHPFFRFLLVSGWRLSEVRLLTWAHVDFPGKKARVRLKGGKIASRALGAEMLSLIAAQPQIKGCPYVFTYVCRKPRQGRRRGQRYAFSKYGWRKSWFDALEAAGVTDFRVHDLRHTRGTRIVRRTNNLLLAKEALGHTNIATTLRYAHASDDDVRWALDASDSRTIPEVPKRNRKKPRNSGA